MIHAPPGGELENTIIIMKKENASQEKLKDAVDASSRQAAALIRPYLSEVQNEILSEILERLVASVAEHSFQIGYSSAMQTFAEAAAALEAGAHVQQ